MLGRRPRRPWAASAGRREADLSRCVAAVKAEGEPKSRRVAAVDAKGETIAAGRQGDGVAVADGHEGFVRCDEMPSHVVDVPSSDRDGPHGILGFYGDDATGDEARDLPWKGHRRVALSEGESLEERRRGAAGAANRPDVGDPFPPSGLVPVEHRARCLS